MDAAYTLLHALPALLVYGLVIASIVEERRGRPKKP